MNFSVADGCKFTELGQCQHILLQPEMSRASKTKWHGTC
jgi:hypothetical protein